MQTYIFILGRQSEIGLAELRSAFGEAELVLPHLAFVHSDTQPNINRLGGTRKIGKVIYDNSGEPSKFLINFFKNLPEGKITLGVSYYGRSVTAANARKTGVYLKNHINRSVRVLPNSTAEITDAASLGNKLGTSSNKVELLMIYLGHRLIIAELIGVQGLNSYTFRDRSRPCRDTKVGMLPPKLAQIMINLAAPGCTANGTLLDPFCGTGVTLQEAALMGFSVYGTDMEQRMVSYTRKNLEWLEQKYHFQVAPRLEIGDATAYTWKKPFDCVVAEAYLGQPYTTPPQLTKLKENMAVCDLIIEKFLKNLRRQIEKNTGICVVVPVWLVGGKKYHLAVIQKLTNLGFETKISPLIYAREGQIVGRELLVLAKR